VATWLSGAGYRTALIGKYLNGYPNSAPSDRYIPPGWTEWYSPISGAPYTNFNYSMNENGVRVDYGAQDNDYMTDVLSNKADDFIRRSIDQHPEQPFFAYIASYAPHSPATPAPRHKDAYPGVKAPRGPAFNEADVGDKAAWNQALPLLNAGEIDQLDKLYRLRLQSLLAVDEMVARLVATLSEKGQLDNTYFVFTSDNGFHLGQHRMKPGKTTGFEEDIQVPLIVRGPGIARGSSTALLTANVDFAATFADIAGLSPPGFVDGRSLLPVLKGQTPADWRQVLLLEHAPDNPNGITGNNTTLEPSDPFDIALFQRGVQGAVVDITAFSGLRTAGGLTYIEYVDAEHELYDNLTDPAQLVNGYPAATDAQKSRLGTWLASLKTAAGAALRQAESTPP
jgi:arylsulfatase A-like enzyme